jgi:hypothetical protein
MLIRCVKNRKNYKNAKLYIPMAILFIALSLSGVGREYYEESVFFGVIMGLIHVASAVILPYVMSTGSVKGIVMIEAVLFVPIILFETVREESIFTGELVLSVAYLLTAILAISLSLMLLVTSLPILLSIGSISGYTYIAAIIGVIIFFALAEIIKLTQ